MNPLIAWPLVIFLTALVTMLGAAVLTGRDPDDATEFPPAGHFDLAQGGGWARPPQLVESVDPFDTEPLLLLSRHAAANAALEREVAEMIDAADQIIGPLTRWRP